MMRNLNIIKQEFVRFQGKIFSLAIEMPLSVHISVTGKKKKKTEKGKFGKKQPTFVVI